MPVAIYDDYADGQRILEKMLAAGKFEKIRSQVDDQALIVVTGRSNG